MQATPTSTMLNLADLNVMSVAQFTHALGNVFERSPWIAQGVASARPFASIAALLAAMVARVAAASSQAQRALIDAHPELGQRTFNAAPLTRESAEEQSGAGLDACTADELAQLHQLNNVYKDTFGFPFLLAVRGHDRASILTQLERRMHNDADTERNIALAEIARIARYRLADLIAPAFGAELIALHDQLAAFSDDADALTCTYLRPAHRATAAAIGDCMRTALLDCSIDAVGNVVGRWRCGQRGAKTLIVGSHYDTVTNAGKYDGRLGILLPILVAGQLRRSGASLPFDLEIIAFAEEEGVRFKSTFLGSAAVTGRFDAKVLDQIDRDGVTMRDAMLAAGHAPADIVAIARDPATLAGYVEIHIEQGPVLLEAQRALGVVTAIAGSVRLMLSVTGRAGHAGTVPMAQRRDAAVAAAEITLAVERRCRLVAGLVGTVGRLEVPGGAINVIPGNCDLSIDIRAGDDAVRDAAVADVLAAIEEIARRRRVSVDIQPVLRAPSAPCATALQEQFAAAITRVTADAAPLHLPSGAGHDAMQMAAITPIGMLFVRCGNDGISHHPDETLSYADADVAARVFADFLMHFQVPSCTPMDSIDV